MRFIVAFAFLILGASALAQEKILPPPPAPKIVPPHPTVKDVERDLKRKRKKREKKTLRYKSLNPRPSKKSLRKTRLIFRRSRFAIKPLFFYPSIQTTGNFRTDYKGEPSLSYKLEFRLGILKHTKKQVFGMDSGCRPSISLEPIEIPMQE